VIMPTLDDVDIAPMQRGDQPRGVVIPKLDGQGDAAVGHGRSGGPPAGRGGVPTGVGPTSSRSGAPAGSRGGGPASGSSPAPTPGKGKQAHVVLDDDEVSSNEDKPLQKRLRQLFVAGPTVPDEAAATTAAADKEATAKRVAGAVGDSPAPGQGPSMAGAKRAAPTHQPNAPTWVFGNLGLSSFLSFFLFSRASFSDYISFCRAPLPPARPPQRVQLLLS
jgi:hypothetical protein